MEPLRLVPIDPSNWRTAYDLRTAPGGERFVAPNGFSLVEAAYDGSGMVPLLAIAGDDAVGFTMYGIDPEDDRPWIVRFMIAAEHEGRGHGRRLLEAVVALLRELRPHRSIRLGVTPDNARAERLYRTFGFVPAGFEMHGETIMDLPPVSE